MSLWNSPWWRWNDADASNLQQWQNDAAIICSSLLRDRNKLWNKTHREPPEHKPHFYYTPSKLVTLLLLKYCCVMFLTIGRVQPCSAVPLDPQLYWTEARTREEVTEEENTKPGKVFKATNEQTGGEMGKRKRSSGRRTGKKGDGGRMTCSGVHRASSRSLLRLCDTRRTQRPIMTL